MDCVTMSIADGIADVRLNRPDRLNAVDNRLVSDMNRTIVDLAARTDVRVVVLSGEGRSFCAGLDLSLMDAGTVGQDFAAREFGDANAMQHLSWGWRTLPMPVIAAVHGVAFGAGLQIMSGADIRIGRADCRLAIRETAWGLVPDMAGFALWGTLVRDDMLRELIYSGKEFTGTEARDLGFLTRLSDDPLQDALGLARSLAARSPDAIAAAKRLSNLAPDSNAREILIQETREQLALMGSANQREAVKAGLEKREPIFPPSCP